MIWLPYWSVGASVRRAARHALKTGLPSDEPEVNEAGRALGLQYIVCLLLIIALLAGAAATLIYVRHSVIPLVSFGAPVIVDVIQIGRLVRRRAALA